MTQNSASPKAIQTRYAGCHFRSRLEARWAVFFNALGVRWEYEPEGFELWYRMDPGNSGKFNYLPDFRLPDLGVWFEVKGKLDRNEAWKIMNAAAAFSAPQGGCGEGDELVLGSTFDRWPVGAPLRFHCHKGDLEITTWWPQRDARRRRCGGVEIARDVGGGFEASVNEAYLDAGGGPSPWSLPGHLTLGGVWHPRYRHAVAAARSARFEHGHSGAS